MDANTPTQHFWRLPGRSVRDLSLMQAFQVEKALSHKLGRCGTTMDLANAFNLIPRWPAACVMQRLGIPWSIIVFWTKSLSRMSSSPVIANTMCDRISSTTGVPEGDVMSVLAMIAISTLFYFRNLNPHRSHTLIIGRGLRPVQEQIFWRGSEHSTLSLS